MADTGDFTDGVTVKITGTLEVPPDIPTTTSIDPEDSEAVNCVDANFITNSEFKYKKYLWSCHYNFIIFLLVESLITPTALFFPLSAVIAGLSDDGTFKVNSNCSGNSTILSFITGTLTLVIVIPLVNVAVNVALLKSPPPESKHSLQHKIA